MSKEMEERRLRTGNFMINNERVLAATNLIREKYNSLCGVEKAVREEGIEKQEFVDSASFLAQEGYIHLRDTKTHEDASLTDSGYQTLEVKVTGKGIRLLAGGMLCGM